MRKFMTVMLCLGLGVSLVMWISNAGQKNTYLENWKNAQRKNEVLQDLYKQDKEEWEETNTALEEERDALITENVLLSRALTQAESEIQARTDAQEQTAAAFDQAKTEWDAQRENLETERDATTGRLSDVLALLMSPMPTSVPQNTDGPANGSLFDVQAAPLPQAPKATPDLTWDVVSVKD